MFFLCSPPVHAVCGGLLWTAAVRLLSDASEREYLRAAEEQGNFQEVYGFNDSYSSSDSVHETRPSSSAASQTETAGEFWSCACVISELCLRARSMQQVRG